MRSTFRDADFAELAEVWNAFYPAAYRIDADMLRQNSVESPVFDWGASLIQRTHSGEVIGFTVVKRSAAPSLWRRGANADVEHLSAVAFRDPQAGIDLLAEAKGILRDRGIVSLTFGSDAHHFFPGCPAEAHNLCAFLMVEGFEAGGEVVDLERDLTDYEPPRPLPTAKFGRLSEADREELEDFLNREFPGRWHHDVMEKVAAEGIASCVHGVWAGGDLVGFAMVQDSSCRKPVNGAVWRASLGPKFGALGPIGVAGAARGEGFGHGLLAAALLSLKERGVERCIIDWTGLIDFYGAHGFVPTRRYRESTLSLND